MNPQESRSERTASCTFDSLKRKSFNVKLYPAAFTTLVLIHRKRWRNAQKSKKRHETFLRGRYSFLFLTLLLRHFFCFLCKPVMITTVKHNKCSYRPDFFISAERVVYLLPSTKKGKNCVNGSTNVAYPTVVMETKAHQKPSHVPLKKERGNSSGFQ